MNVVLPSLDKLTELPVVMEINDHGEAVGSLFCTSKDALVAYARASKEKKVRTGAAAFLGVPGEILEYTGRQAAVAHRALKGAARTTLTAAKKRRAKLEAQIAAQNAPAPVAAPAAVAPATPTPAWYARFGGWLAGR
jgi:hypothetical protein